MNYELKQDEKIIFGLRSLYEACGYVIFKSGKFEEYDIYGRYKDFLAEDGILTFNDPSGKLMVLKPDISLSIAKTISPAPSEMHKFYYNDEVYRLDKGAGAYKEISQTGIECIGPIGDAEVLEVITLAIKSLDEISPDSKLVVSHNGIIRQIAKETALSDDAEKELIGAIAEKSLQSIRRVCNKNGVSSEIEEAIEKLIHAYGPIGAAIATIESIFGRDVSFVMELEKIGRELASKGLDKRVVFDFSVLNDMRYYNGVIFQGFVQGISTRVLSGGRYDNLMTKMGKRCGAIGFAINIDLLLALDEMRVKKDFDYLTIALPKGRLGDSVYKMFEKAGFDCPEMSGHSRKLIFDNLEKKIRFVMVKPADVGIYVERGAADIGVVGKDVLLETEPDIYELLDLRCGICEMMVAGKVGWKEDTDRPLIVATKFPKIAQKYFAEKSRDVDTIKLNGSIEIAPLLDLSDVIVDIVETGSTLRANGLEPKEKICDISARLIANKASHKFKNLEINEVLNALQEI